MTKADLEQHVWDNLPPLRRAAAGRAVVSRIVATAARNWPAEVLMQCDAGESQVVARYFTKTVERSVRQQQYGMGIILTIVLATLVQEIVKVMLHWWLDRGEHRVAMLEIMREVQDHD